MSIWVVSTNSNLSSDERKEQRKIIENNGLEWYARFNDETVARKFANKIKQCTKIELVVSQVYSTSISI